MKKRFFNILRALIVISFCITLITSILAQENTPFPADEGYVKGTISDKSCLIVIQPITSLKKQTADSVRLDLFNQGLQTENRVLTARGEDLIGVTKLSETVFEIRMDEEDSTICVKIKNGTNSIIEFDSETTTQDDGDKIIAQGAGYLVECDK